MQVLIQLPVIGNFDARAQSTGPAVAGVAVRYFGPASSEFSAALPGAAASIGHAEWLGTLAAQFVGPEEWSEAEAGRAAVVVVGVKSLGFGVDPT